MDSETNPIIDFSELAKQASAPLTPLEREQKADFDRSQKPEWDLMRLKNQLLKAQSDWLFRKIKAIIPWEYEHWVVEARKGDVDSFRKCLAWLDENGFNLVEDGLTLVLRKGDKVVSEFKAKLKKV